MLPALTKMNTFFKACLIFCILTLFCSSCQHFREKELPVYKTIPEFEFINQDSQIVNNESFKNKAYVVDFFFTSCPTICPVMAQQMLRIHDHFIKEDRLHLVSHTIDIKRDSIPKLKKYAENLGVSAPKWHFVTGEKNEIYDIAESYYNLAIEDPTLPDGFDHSGRFVLVDKNRQVRAFCNGTNPEEVDKFIQDIEKLLHEDRL